MDRGGSFPRPCHELCTKATFCIWYQITVARDESKKCKSSHSALRGSRGSIPSGPCAPTARLQLPAPAPQGPVEGPEILTRGSTTPMRPAPSPQRSPYPTRADRAKKGPSVNEKGGAGTPRAPAHPPPHCVVSAGSSCLASEATTTATPSTCGATPPSCTGSAWTSAVTLGSLGGSPASRAIASFSSWSSLLSLSSSFLRKLAISSSYCSFRMCSMASPRIVALSIVGLSALFSRQLGSMSLSSVILSLIFCLRFCSVALWLSFLRCVEVPSDRPPLPGVPSSRPRFS
mmetsp:Transcript_59968/g.147436  ORF Transcript_59968/g.147436 Transcript_59968/m.147436 type:complete len:288 (-) Transcript_59968:403-1266(-)